MGEKPEAHDLNLIRHAPKLSGLTLLTVSFQTLGERKNPLVQLITVASFFSIHSS